MLYDSQLFIAGAQHATSSSKMQVHRTLNQFFTENYPFPHIIRVYQCTNAFTRIIFGDSIQLHFVVINENKHQ